MPSPSPAPVAGTHPTALSSSPWALDRWGLPEQERPAGADLFRWDDRGALMGPQGPLWTARGAEEVAQGRAWVEGVHRFLTRPPPPGAASGVRLSEAPSGLTHDVISALLDARAPHPAAVRLAAWTGWGWRKRPHENAIALELLMLAAHDVPQRLAARMTWGAEVVGGLGVWEFDARMRLNALVRGRVAVARSGRAEDGWLVAPEDARARGLCWALPLCVRTAPGASSVTTRWRTSSRLGSRPMARIGFRRMWPWAPEWFCARYRRIRCAHRFGR